VRVKLKTQDLPWKQHYDTGTDLDNLESATLCDMIFIRSRRRLTKVLILTKKEFVNAPRELLMDFAQAA